MVEPKKVQVVEIENRKKIGVVVYVFLVVYSFLLFRQLCYSHFSIVRARGMYYKACFNFVLLNM